MTGYDLGEILRGQLEVQKAEPSVSESDTAEGREQIEYIDIDRIKNDTKNFYTLSNLNELAANIELLGLQQPLRVRPDLKNPEQVIIVSGHRRRAAIQRLVDEGRTDLREVPCIREAPAQSAALQELRLIYANSDTRTLTSAEISRQAARVEELLYLLKEEGMEFPGRMRDHVAEACKISGPKLARLKVIREKLVPEYMKLFDQNRLPEQTAYTLARLPAEFQQRLASALSEVPSGRAVEKILEKYEAGWRWEPELTCPDGNSCKRGDTFLRRDCETDGWQALCGGKTCCLKCDKAKASYSPCQRMCSKAKAQRRNDKAEKDAAEFLRKQKIGRKYQKETQVYAKRLLRAIDAANLADDVRVPWRYTSHSVGEIRQWAAGEFDDPDRWFSARLVPDECFEPLKTANVLKCSTDFLVGLTDELHPVVVPKEFEEEDIDNSQLGESKGDLPQELDDVSQAEPSARVVRWEDRDRMPPVGALVITYRQGDNGCGFYQAGVWDGTHMLSPSTGDDLSGLQYTQWLEIPIPVTGEAVQLPPPEEAEGQLVLSGWMPGGTFPHQPCDVVADFQCGDGDTAVTLREVCYFDGAAFLFMPGGSKIDADLLRWMVLPPVADVSDSDTFGEGVCEK